MGESYMETSVLLCHRCCQLLNVPVNL